MPAYNFQTDLDEIHFPSNREFVAKFKKTPVYGDLRESLDAAFQKVPDKGSNPALWWMTFSEQACLRLIVEWNLTDDADQLVPITVENLHRLKKGDGDFLIGEAGKRMEARPEEDEIPFVNGSGGRSAATTAATRRKS